MNVQLTVDLDHEDFTGTYPIGPDEHDLAPRYERVVEQIREALLTFDRSKASMSTFPIRSPWTGDKIGDVTLQSITP